MVRLVKEGLMHMQKHFLEMKFAYLYVLHIDKQWQKELTTYNIEDISI